MYWDAILAMICYTAVTAMFYLLGAAVLHRTGSVPAKDQLISELGTMYTSSIGPGARLIFVFGAVIVLYSTMFAALAAWSRMYSDAFGQIGILDYRNPRSRKRAIGFFAWTFPVAWTFLYLFFESPAMMVIFGGVTTVVILLIVVYAALYFRYRKLDSRLRPSVFYDIALWTSALAIFTVAVIGAKDLIFPTHE